MTKPAITIDLNELERLMRLYVLEVAEPDSLVDWRLSDFLLWIQRKRQETTDEKYDSNQGVDGFSSSVRKLELRTTDGLPRPR